MSFIFRLKMPTLAALLVLLMPLLACGQAEKYIAGTSYEVLESPVRTRDSSKVEVVEVFWYGCSHCYNFEPVLQKWHQRQAEDVDFWQSPALWNEQMKTHAQIFYTAKSLGVLDKMHAAIFTAINVERKRLTSQSEIENLFLDYGVKAEDVNKTFSSFGVNSQVKQADARARSYMITGTPEIVVNGKYRITARLAGGQSQMLDVVDFLVNKERAQLAMQ
jgi:protein dithiol oxidoreductase (disulfide-forming)